MKFIKYIFKTIKWMIVVALVAVAAVVVFLLTLDVNKYKPEIEKIAREKTGRNWL